MKKVEFHENIEEFCISISNRNYVFKFLFNWNKYGTLFVSALIFYSIIIKNSIY